MGGRPRSSPLFDFFNIIFSSIGALPERGSKLTLERGNWEYTLSLLFLLLGLFYLSLTSYAYTILPLIPAERGGGSYCQTPIVTIARQSGDKKDRIANGTIVYTSSDTIFLATDATPGDSCRWKSRPDFPTIVGIPKEGALLTINPVFSPSSAQPKVSHKKDTVGSHTTNISAKKL